MLIKFFVIKMKLQKELREKKALGKGKERQCSARGCTDSAIRSLSENTWSKYVEKAGMKLDENRQHKIYLCKKHYNSANKVRKSQEKLYQKKGFLDNSKSSKSSKVMKNLE